MQRQIFEIGEYRFRVSSTGHGSSHYGPCEVCGKHADTTYIQSRFRRYSFPEDGVAGWASEGSVFGHPACLEKERKAIEAAEASRLADINEISDYEEALVYSTLCVPFVELSIEDVAQESGVARETVRACLGDLIYRGLVARVVIETVEHSGLVSSPAKRTAYRAVETE